VDLDTLLASTIASKLKGKKLIFDAHEIFYEVPELTGKPLKKWIWKQVARWCIPYTDLRITVNNSLKEHYEKQYDRNFHVIRNVPDVSLRDIDTKVNNKVMVYLGAVNTGRGVELAIRSLQTLIEHRLVIIGDGDEYDQMRDLAVALNVIHRVDFRGYTTPDKIFSILQECSIGLNVLVAESDNYRLSLANKFFDYMHAGLPSVNMRYPEYENIINDHHVGIMIRDYNVDDLVTAVRMLDNIDLYNQLADNCSKFKHLYTWNREKEVLVGLYDLLW
jgi:glycosyltransferase involved in cell wall biosynthesis